MERRALTVSVAMATYNGAQFLEAQLDSIANQTRPPDELVVCDDGSVDNSIKILERFASQASFDVRISRNPERLGYVENFLQAGRLCRSDLIAWCDQDDVWFPGKLDRCLEELDKDPEVILVVHSWHIGDGARRGPPIVHGARTVHTPRSLPLELDIPGFACVFTRTVLEIADSLEAKLSEDFREGGLFGHDAWTIFVAGALGKVVFLPEVLVHYRQHDGNVYGSPPLELTRAARARISVARSITQFEEGLQSDVARALFRCALLDRIAERVDGDGPIQRRDLWSRKGQASGRRLELYRRRPRSAQAVVHLFRSVAHVDYRNRTRGGLGVSSLLRDVGRVVGAFQS